jgi:hypothetical protein
MIGPRARANFTPSADAMPACEFRPDSLPYCRHAVAGRGRRIVTRMFSTSVTVMP